MTDAKRKGGSGLTRGEVLLGAAALAGGMWLPGCGAGPMEEDFGFEPPGDEEYGSSGDELHTPGCEETEDNIEGPFYRPNAPWRSRIAAPSEGIPLVITGVIQGHERACVPLSGALVDVWQANAQGVYDRTSTAYRWRGRAQASSGGVYRIETIVPGRYLNGAEFRPRHIHFKFSAPGFALLTTQLYFRGDPYLANDAFVHPKLVRGVSWTGSVYLVRFPIVLAPA